MPSPCVIRPRAETETALDPHQDHRGDHGRLRAWCDSLTRRECDFVSLDARARGLGKLTATRHEAIGKICPKKRTLSRRTQRRITRTWVQTRHPRLLGRGILNDNHRIRITGTNLAGLSVRRRRRVPPLKSQLYHQGCRPSDNRQSPSPQADQPLVPAMPLPSAFGLDPPSSALNQHLAQRSERNSCPPSCGD